MTDMQEVLTAIAKAKGLVRKIDKADKNQHDGYKFASIDAFLEMVNPITAECGLITHLDEESVEEFDKRGRNGDTPWLRTTYLITVYHVSGQFMPPVRRRVEILRNGAQAFGSSQSYVLKQFYRGLLEIPTGDGDDADHRATDASPVRRAQARTVSRTPHDPQTGEVYDAPPPEAPQASFAPEVGNENTIRSGQSFVDQVYDRCSKGENSPPHEKAQKTAELLIEKIREYKSVRGLAGFLAEHQRTISSLHAKFPAICETVTQANNAQAAWIEAGCPADHVGSEFGLPPINRGASA